MNVENETFRPWIPEMPPVHQMLEKLGKGPLMRNFAKFQKPVHILILAYSRSYTGKFRFTKMPILSSKVARNEITFRCWQCIAVRARLFAAAKNSSSSKSSEPTVPFPGSILFHDVPKHVTLGSCKCMHSARRAKSHAIAICHSRWDSFEKSRSSQEWAKRNWRRRIAGSPSSRSHPPSLSLPRCWSRRSGSETPRALK